MLNYYSGQYSLLLLEKCMELLQEYRLESQKIEQADPWVKFAGMFEDDPLSKEFFEDMSTHRRELDAELDARKVGSEENQPV
jgi:hypothetical protein